MCQDTHCISGRLPFPIHIFYFRFSADAQGNRASTRTGRLFLPTPVHFGIPSAGLLWIFPACQHLVQQVQLVNITMMPSVLHARLYTWSYAGATNICYKFILGQQSTTAMELSSCTENIPLLYREVSSRSSPFTRRAILLMRPSWTS